MDDRGVDELREELSRLMLEHVASIQGETFGGLDAEDLRKQQERLKRIREVAADYLAALKRNT